MFLSTLLAVLAIRMLMLESIMTSRAKPTAEITRPKGPSPSSSLLE